MDDLERELSLYEDGKMDELIELLDQPEPQKQASKPINTSKGSLNTKASKWSSPSPSPALSSKPRSKPFTQPKPTSRPNNSTTFRNTSELMNLSGAPNMFNPGRRADSDAAKSTRRTLKGPTEEETTESISELSTTSTTSPTRINGPVKSGTLVNGRLKRPYLANKQPEKQFEPKPVRGIDENWFLQKTEEGINVLEYTERLPLSVPNQDLFKLNSVRSAAKRALRSPKKHEELHAQADNTEHNIENSEQDVTHASNEFTEMQDISNDKFSPKVKMADFPPRGENANFSPKVKMADFPPRAENANFSADSEPLSNQMSTAHLSGLITGLENNDDEKPKQDVNSMLSSGSELLTKVRNLLQSNIPIPINGLEGVEEENDANKPVLPEDKILELHQVQDKWLELDNEIKGIRSLIKDLQAKQRELSEYLKSEMLKYQIPHLKSLQGDKIILKSQNRKGTYKKDYIYTKLQEVLQDPEMAAKLSEHLENERPVSECINLSRTKK
jgi:hypothetical protein